MLADAGIGTVRRAFLGEKPGLVSVLFHNIFHDKSAVLSGLAYPQERVIQAQFRCFLDCWRQAGYRFVSSRNIIEGLDAAGKYVLLTFDDGYCSILDVLPIIEEYQIPAILFVTSSNIETGHAYWPDVVYREEFAKGASVTEISTLIESFKKKHNSDIQQLLLERYGTTRLFQVDDIARPLTEQELVRLAIHPLIEIGNHTANHIDLTVCSVDEIRKEISGCQKSIARITGKNPVAISYPFGRYNDKIIDSAKSEGLMLGFTCDEGKNILPLNGNALKIRRYHFLGDSAFNAQCDRFRSDIHFFWPITKYMFSSAISLRSK